MDGVRNFSRKKAQNKAKKKTGSKFFIGRPVPSSLFRFWFAGIFLRHLRLFAAKTPGYFRISA